MMMYSLRIVLVIIVIALASIAEAFIAKTSHEERCFGNYLPFEEPHEVRSKDGVLDVDLIVDIGRYQGVFSFTTRMYNGSIPGPTIRVKPGDLLRVRVVNRLGDQAIDEWDAYSYHSPNTTALHVHGLHVAAEGYSDMIFYGIGPNETHQYEYYIPKDHYPGTHWYHAHYHGSTTFQVMGGMAGALIVDPPEGWLPFEYSSLQWHVCVLQNFRFDVLKGGFLSVSTEIGNVVNPDFETCMVDEENQTSVYTVNGLYEPYLTMEVGEYRVLQLIHAIGDVYSLELVLSDPEACSMWTIGKDGVFFEHAVREHVIFMWSASRVDVLVSCSKAGNYSLLSNGSDYANAWFYNVEDGSTRISQNIIFFHIVESTVEARQEVRFDEVIFPPKPIYLQDLVNLNESEIAQTIDIVGNYDLLSLNGDRFINATSYSYFLELGQIYQLNLYADNYTHPMHLHINHFQIVQVSPTGDLGDFNQDWQVEHSEFLWNVGEWRDTIPTVAGYRISVRFRADTWSGPMLYHCHYLPHADHGMMMILYINHPNDEDNTVPAIHEKEQGKEEIDYQDYEDFFRDDQDDFPSNLPNLAQDQDEFTFL